MEKTIYSEEYGLLLHILRATREVAGITQIELASRLGTTQVNVSRYEGGQRGLDPIHLKYWCEAIGITVHDLYQELDATLAHRRLVDKASKEQSAKKRPKRDK
ncbi:helix-turn-helix domain-containing protein [Burkholderia cepacia]|uniref:helix-turn-helix domain-containing protein n=1 Tax=Burkholderia cepacia TaxID=292 RepID=UPI002ABE9EBF|nr:helix-turn-helix transcriptional regulator [Burkholderia cepacia]